MTKLSPTTQAVLDAFRTSHTGQGCLAAALRVVAEIVAPLSYEDIWTDGRMLQYKKDDPVRNKLLAIADELEDQ
jgi:hypothetical protein